VLKHADDRLSRWALNLMTFKFSVEHINGDENVVADMLSRWRVEYPQTVCGANFKPAGLPSALHKAEFVWPELQGSLTDEEITEHDLTPKILKDEIVLVRKDTNRVFVPDLENLR
jgi:hypothetical protein